MVANKITSRIIINGTELAAQNWTMHLGSYGSINTFQLVTSIQAVKLIKFDIFGQQKKNPAFPIQVYIVVNGIQSLIFTGIIDDIEGLWHTDELEITGRDNSAILRDEMQVLNQEQYFNQPISSVVTQIAQKYGFTPKVTSTSQLAGVRYLATNAEETAFTDKPRPLWHTLQLFAHITGYVLYVTPKNELYFGPPASGKNHTYVWRPSPANADQVPVLELAIKQQSRRCQNFTVYVASYDNSTKQLTEYTAMGGTGSGPTYTFHPAGLTQADVVAYAQARVVEIARRDLIITTTVDGDPKIDVNDQITIQEANSGDLLGLSNQKMYVSGLTHSFQMPEYGSDTGEGFLSHITAIRNIQPVDEGN